MSWILNGVAKGYGDDVVFEDVSLELAPGQRLALIGENGSGKSTLLRLLAGLDLPDAGTVRLDSRPALLTQTNDTGRGRLLEAVTPPDLRGAQVAFARATEGLATGTPEALERFSAAEEQYRQLGGYDWEGRAASVLSGLGLDPQADAARLSGGQARRLMLARLLLAPADLYLLDEPTNHLDAASTEWLEHWLRASSAAFVIASHDRAFLDAVAGQVAELERGQLTLYPGTYTAAMQLKATLRAAQARDHAAYQRQRSALEEEARRRQSKAHSANTFNPKRARDNDKFLANHKAQVTQNVNASQARALERRMERLTVIEKPFDDHRRLRLDLPDALPGPAEVLRIRNLMVERGGRAVINGLSLDVRRGERLALVGPNGSGKSTLLAAVRGALPYGGELQLGQGLQLAWAGQHGEELAGLHTLADALLDANVQLTPHQLYEIAAQVGLPPDPTFPLSGLSGGQRTRLTLARLGVTRAQLLLLDEPTNHLDVRAIEALEQLLLDFPGTVLLASHDRRLVERVATRRLELGA
ncbi:ABC-F family ATP-binding cassette domain-containing protein [Deinococcus sonorensis]|uniref:ABC-F family ATP-binding cassette domain-containing protein n=2 Tax=Deinococcus sonorensis TaxID=309891 RepID=A0AAU7U7I6_9DEIO